MPKLKTTRRRLAAGHGWRSQPHHKILVLGRGAVQLEIPDTWVVKITDDCVKIHDREPPDDDCVLGVSYHHWPAVGQALSVASLVGTALEGDGRRFSSVGPIVEESRVGLALAWVEGRHRDEKERREACSRLCIARQDEIQALLTFDFWLSQAERCGGWWRDILSTLQLGQWVEDPLKGPELS